MLTLFKSRADRQMEARVRAKMGKSKINRFIQQSKRSADRYFELCRKAMKSGDIAQFQLLAGHFSQVQQSIQRWERFLVKLESLELRKNEVCTTKEFLQTMSGLTDSILSGVSPKEVLNMQADIAKAIEKSQSQEDAIELAMETAFESFEIDSENTSIETSIPSAENIDRETANAENQKLMREIEKATLKQNSN